MLSPLLAHAQAPQPAFAVASIRPASRHVRFERDGETTITPNSLRMQDVTISTCIRWAYAVQPGQLVGPPTLFSDHFDIVAKPDDAASEAAMKRMMQTLLEDRFHLAFHHEQRELHSFSLVVNKAHLKADSGLHPSAPGGEPYRQNSAMGMVTRSWTMAQFAAYIASPLQAPVVDETGLTGPYDFTLDFTPYVSNDGPERPDVVWVLNQTLQGELGLKLEPRKQMIDVIVIDKIEAPTAN